MYQFTTTDPDLKNAFDAGESAQGDLEDARQLATGYECRVELSDEPGFAKGTVYADGSYTLS